MEYNALLYNLNKINSISEYDKISINNGIIYIEKKNIFRPLKRYINNQNREKSYLFIFKNIVQKSLEEIKKYILFYQGKSKFNQSQLNIQDIDDYYKFIEKFRNIKKSLKILKISYSDDKIFQRKIELMITNIIENERKLHI